MITIVLGAIWGDEGKGKLVDILSSRSSLCCRAQGGNNAGHTIVANGTTYDFHSLPSGLLNPKCKNLIGSGCVVHIPSLFEELDALEEKGIRAEAGQRGENGVNGVGKEGGMDGVGDGEGEGEGRVWVSDRAQVVFDLHLLMDGFEEGELKGGKVGTTGKGIGPAYSGKVGRRGVPVNQVFDTEDMAGRLRALAKGVEKRFGGLGSYDVEEEIRQFEQYRERLRPMVVDAVEIMDKAQKEDEVILVEGANALMLDIDHGTYPYVTSSNTGTGGAVTGLALDTSKIKEIIGVVKAYTTRVGSGPFPTELLDEDGDKLQSIGREFGVTTGRRRRTGWLDLLVLKYSHAVNHYTSLNLTKLDILDTFPTIKVAVAYKVDGQLLTSFPANLRKLQRCEVVYEELPGWMTESTGVKTFEELPLNARRYVEFVEEKVGVRIQWIGTGPKREDMITR